jgi:hypothetical protein
MFAFTTFKIPHENLRRYHVKAHVFEQIQLASNWDFNAFPPAPLANPLSFGDSVPASDPVEKGFPEGCTRSGMLTFRGYFNLQWLI